MTPPRFLFLIPARGGSKGLPKKNIRPMNGRPLIAWTIDTALKACELYPGSRAVVSTDDESIANTAKEFGAYVPFMRPAHLAADTSTSIDVVLHALEHLEGKGESFDLICMLEPTSPQRDENDIKSAAEQLLNTENAESIVGVCRSESGHPAFLAKMNDKKFISPLNGGQFKFLRRQEIDDVYFFEGSLYISKVESMKSRKSFYHENTLGYEVDKWKSFEVDDIVDFLIIERLMKARSEGEI